MSEVEAIGVVGAGFMGAGIAESAAAKGVRATLYEPSRAPLDRARRSLDASVERSVARGRLSDGDGQALIERISYTTELSQLGGVDAVVEAVIEDPRVKGKLFAELDKELPDARFLASNTSSIPIAELAAWTQRRDRVLGLHFFAPVPVMKLVEVVVALDTGDDTLAWPKPSPAGSASRRSGPRTAPGSSSTCCWFPTDGRGADVRRRLRRS